MAGYSAAIKLNNLVITSFTTLGNGVSNYTACLLYTSTEDLIAVQNSGVYHTFSLYMEHIGFFIGKHFRRKGEVALNVFRCQDRLSGRCLLYTSRCV